MHYGPALNVKPLVYWIANDFMLITFCVAFEAVAQNVLRVKSKRLN
jgi:hypothetical protein